MKISQVFKHFKGRKGSQVERRRGRRRERWVKGVALQTSPGTCRYPREDWNSALPETRIRIRIQVLCQEEVISLQSSAQAEALRPDSCIQDLGTRKKGEEREG